jgi:hypothetical protein
MAKHKLKASYPTVMAMQDISTPLYLSETKMKFFFIVNFIKALDKPPGSACDGSGASGEELYPHWCALRLVTSTAKFLLVCPFLTQTQMS